MTNSMTTINIRCGHGRCPFVGPMPIRQTSPGCAASSHGPEELPEREATCPKCHRTRHLSGDEVACDACGIFDDPDQLTPWERDDDLCRPCWHTMWKNVGRKAPMAYSPCPGPPINPARVTCGPQHEDMT